jgi:hypothetical protein
MRRDLVRALHLLECLPLPETDRDRLALEALLILWLSEVECDEKTRMEARRRAARVHYRPASCVGALAVLLAGGYAMTPKPQPERSARPTSRARKAGHASPMRLRWWPLRCRRARRMLAVGRRE